MLGYNFKLWTNCQTYNSNRFITFIEEININIPVLVNCHREFDYLGYSQDLLDLSSLHKNQHFWCSAYTKVCGDWWLCYILDKDWKYFVIDTFCCHWPKITSSLLFIHLRVSRVSLLSSKYPMFIFCNFLMNDCK